MRAWSAGQDEGGAESTPSCAGPSQGGQGTRSTVQYSTVHYSARQYSARSRTKDFVSATLAGPGQGGQGSRMGCRRNDLYMQLCRLGDVSPPPFPPTCRLKRSTELPWLRCGSPPPALLQERLNSGELKRNHAEQLEFQRLYGTVDWRAQKKLRKEKRVRHCTVLYCSTVLFRHRGNHNFMLICTES